MNLECGGGWSVTVGYDGEVIYHEYTIGTSYVEPGKVLGCCPELVTDIENILGKFKDELEKLPTQIGSEEECFDTQNVFRFAGKEICTWDIHKTNDDELQRMFEKHGQEYVAKLLQRNKIIQIYDEIAEAINKHHLGIVLTRERKFHIEFLSFFAE